jgi:oligosaccharide repeat unit polymerase
MSTAAVQQQVAPDSHPVAWLLVLALLPLICFTAVASGTAALVAMAFAIASVALTIRAARLAFGHSSTPTSLFLKLASVHAIVGFAIAGPTSSVIWGSSNISQFYGPAFLVITVGLLSTAVTYSIAVTARMPSIIAFTQKLRVDDDILVRCARVLLVIGGALMFYIYAHLDMLPLFSSSAGTARYFTQEMSDSYMRDEWLVNRALDLLTYTVPLVFCSALWRKRRIDLVLAAFGFIALLLPLRRANLMSVFVLSLVMLALKKGTLRITPRMVAIALILLLAYAGSQLIFFGVLTGADADLSSGAAAVGSALPELRDLGWIMSLARGGYWYGVTFIQPLVPLPSFISDFSQRNSLRAITTALIGLDQEQTTGGLRLTLAGEAFLNFSYVGPIVVGALFGLACAWLDRFSAYAVSASSPHAIYLAALLFCWLCLWIHLAGTQAAATVKVGLIQTAAMLFISRKRSFILTPS